VATADSLRITDRPDFRRQRMRFEVPEVPFNESGWGPCTLPAHLKDVPYAPYGKNDRIGRVADWTSSGRDHHGHGGKYDKRREREKQEAAAAGASVFGGAAFQTEEEDSFSLVDSRPTYKPRYGRRPQRFISRREREKEREEQIKLQGGPAAQAAKLQRPKRKENWNYYRRDFNRFKYAASVDIRPEWTVLAVVAEQALVQGRRGYHLEAVRPPGLLRQGVREGDPEEREGARHGPLRSGVRRQVLPSRRITGRPN